MKNTLKTSFLRFNKAAFCCAACAILTSVSNAQTLISHYTLDGTVADSGSLGIDGALINSASFVSGGVGSFNQALSTDSVGSQNFFRADTSDNPAYGMNAITISMWVNLSSYNDGDRLVSNVTSANGFDLYLKSDVLSAGDYRLAFNFNSTSGAVQSADNVAYQTSEWVFLAVTYDSSIVSGDNVFFYVGDETSTIVMNDSAAKTGSINVGTADFEIGGTPATTGDRTPVALYNDVRIYNGALDLASLEAIRTAAIPEPAHFSILIGGFLLGLAVLKRRN
ncbi:MAG TPA: hypothetical protein DEA90_09960 [Opitutae bacterium]|nr:hypothetical protein [Puniceicoccaceae bacterium]HBR94476.1 hypothetical protein [Opitutae bacterium]|tara:strand:- start:13307 stop:14146 length:840 start_codon:yes stop_codon:yes gene_type:complete